MNEIECETCIKRKTKYCPNSSECLDTKDKPYYQNRIMLLEENQQKEDIINKANNYVIDNANIYLNIYGEKIGFFKENDGKTPIELLKILDNKGE